MEKPRKKSPRQRFSKPERDRHKGGTGQTDTEERQCINRYTYFLLKTKL